jgi:hypothetical protein
MQRFTDLFANCAGMDPIEVDAVCPWARHDGSSCCNSIQLQDQVLERALVHPSWQKSRNRELHLGTACSESGGLNGGTRPQKLTFGGFLLRWPP